MSVADVHTGETGLVRTDCHCHQCAKVFIAQLDFRLEGAHVIHCPYCDHAHYRRIAAGKITEERKYGSRKKPIRAATWKTADEEGVLNPVSTAAEFIRDRWLNFGSEAT